MDLHLYRNAQDRWHDLRRESTRHGAILAINRFTLDELAEKLAVESQPSWLGRFERVVLHAIYDPTEAEFGLIRNLIRMLPGGGTVVVFNNTANINPTQFAEWTWRRFIQDDSLAERSFPEFCRPSSPNSPLLERLFVYDAGLPPLDPLSSVRIIRTSTRYREVETIGSEIAGLLATGAEANDIAVAVRHIDIYAEMIADVFTRYDIPHRFESGLPLLHVPFIKYWFALLALVASERARAALARVLASAYFEPRLSPRLDVEQELETFGYIDRHHLRASELARRKQSPLAVELERLESLLDRLESSTDIISGFLRRLPSPNGVSSADQQAWHILADELTSSAARTGPVSFLEFRILAREIAVSKTVDRTASPAGGPGAAPVEIISPYALGHREYRWLFAPGMVAGEFPSNAGAPSGRNRLDPLFLFMLLDSASDRTTLTFPSATLEGDPIDPSTYIAEIARHFASGVIERQGSDLPIHDRGECLRRIADDWRRGWIGDRTARELLGDERTRRIAIERRGSARADLGIGVVDAASTWHPSELNTLSSCPFVFFARHRLNLRPEDVPDFEIPTRELGKLAHDVLREFYRTPVPASESAANIRMQDIIRRRLANVDSSGEGVFSVFEPSIWKIRRQQLVAALEEHVRFAVKDALDGFETMTEYLNEPLPAGRLGSITLGGRPDHVAVRRIRNRTEGIRVDDFKYSAASSATGKALKSSFQIPGYAYLAAHALHADQSTQMEGRYVLLRSPSTPVITQMIALSDFGELALRIEALVEKVRQGDLHPDPSDRQECITCRYRRLCRMYGV